MISDEIDMNGVVEMDSFRRSGNTLISLHNGWKSGHSLSFHFLCDIFKHLLIYDS